MAAALVAGQWPIFTATPSGKSDRKNHFFSLFRRQGLQRGNLSRHYSFIHGVHIQPDKGNDKGEHQQPDILADPGLPFDSLASLQIEEPAVVFLFHCRTLCRILLRRTWRLIEASPMLFNTMPTTTKTKGMASTNMGCIKSPLISIP
jgi:hypothetical protein